MSAGKAEAAAVAAAVTTAGELSAAVMQAAGLRPGTGAGVDLPGPPGAAGKGFDRPESASVPLAGSSPQSSEAGQWPSPTSPDSSAPAFGLAKLVRE
jgi:hypothetical protein